MMKSRSPRPGPTLSLLSLLAMLAVVAIALPAGSAASRGGAEAATHTSAECAKAKRSRSNAAKRLRKLRREDAADEKVAKAKKRLKKARKRARRACGGSHGVELRGRGSCSHFPGNTSEEECDVSFDEEEADDSRAHAAGGGPVDAIKIVLPSGHSVIAFLCPSDLPQGSIQTTTGANDTLVCEGGSLALGKTVKLNIRSTVAFATGQAGQLFGRRGGAFAGPFAMSGP